MRMLLSAAGIVGLLPFYSIWCPSQVLGAESDATDSTAVVAAALDVDPAGVTILDSQLTDGGKCRRVVAALEDAESDANTVVVEYETERRLIRRVAWNGRAGASENTVSLEEALERAQSLMTRLFPPVPCNMMLITTTPVGSMVTRDGKSYSPLVYHFGWRGNGPGGAETGDTAGAFISAATGEPVAYYQRVAPKRPVLEEIKISRERAVEATIEQIKREWREGGNVEVTVEITRVGLVLSSPASLEQNPVWLINAIVEDKAGGEQLDQTQRAMDAYSGEFLW